MNDNEAAASRSIHANRRTFSAAVVDRQYALHPELEERYGERGREKCVEDTQFHLAHLSGALLASSPALFGDYIAWSAGVMAVASVRTEDLRENLTCMRDVLADRLPVGQADAAAGYVRSAMKRLDWATAGPPSFLPEGGPLEEVAGEFLLRLLRCDRRAAGRLILNAVDSGVSIRDVYLRVIRPSQREAGRLWESGRITPAQEHYCTAATQVIMAQLAPRLFDAERNGRKVVVTTVAGETHVVGARMIADLLELGGWDTIYLGGDVPPRGVARVLAEHGADLLAVSATMTFNLHSVVDLIAAVLADPACAGVRVMVGGRLFDAEPELWRRVGADGQPADADDVCRLAELLVSAPAGPAVAGAPGVVEGGRGGEPPAARPPAYTGDLYDEMGRLNSEVVALNRELSRKNAEVRRLHARVTRQALELAEAHRNKDEFLAVLGHELRNPLASIRNALALLGPDDPDAETVRWARDVMSRQVPHMVRLVDDLLDLSRIIQGKLALRPERCDLAAVIANAVESARPLIDVKGHELLVSLPDRPVVLDADPVRLAQVMVNLLNNAAKYTDPGGRIELSACRDGAEAVVAVKDNGVGIAPELVPSIFELFTQEGRSLSRSQEGLGIGLALVKNLVEMHGGRVSVRSEGQGRGSEFEVRLPAPEVATPAPVPAAPRDDRRASGEGLPRRRVLVVDDNVDAAKSLARLLSRLYGQDVRSAHDGIEALRVAGEFLPEVVLLDITMPGIDGNEVARRLRERPESSGALLVALSGWGQESDIERSKAAGFDHHLIKPASAGAILELLREAGQGG